MIQHGWESRCNSDHHIGSAEVRRSLPRSLCIGRFYSRSFLGSFYWPISPLNGATPFPFSSRVRCWWSPRHGTCPSPSSPAHALRPCRSQFIAWPLIHNWWMKGYRDSLKNLFNLGELKRIQKKSPQLSYLNFNRESLMVKIWQVQTLFYAHLILLTVYKAQIHSCFEFCSNLWVGDSKYSLAIMGV